MQKTIEKIAEEKFPYPPKKVKPLHITEKDWQYACSYIKTKDAIDEKRKAFISCFNEWVEPLREALLSYMRAKDSENDLDEYVKLFKILSSLPLKQQNNG